MHEKFWGNCQADSNVICNFSRTMGDDVNVMGSRGPGLLKPCGGRKLFESYLKSNTPETLPGVGRCGQACSGTAHAAAGVQSSNCPGSVTHAGACCALRTRTDMSTQMWSAVCARPQQVCTLIPGKRGLTWQRGL